MSCASSSTPWRPTTASAWRSGAFTLVTVPGDDEVTVVTDETMGEEDPLLARLLAAATACPRCKTPLRLIALIQTDTIIKKILSAMGLPPQPYPARPPPSEPGSDGGGWLNSPDVDTPGWRSPSRALETASPGPSHRGKTAQARSTHALKTALLRSGRVR